MQYPYFLTCAEDKQIFALLCLYNAVGEYSQQQCRLHSNTEALVHLSLGVSNTSARIQSISVTLENLRMPERQGCVFVRQQKRSEFHVTAACKRLDWSHFCNAAYLTPSPILNTCVRGVLK